MSQLLQQLNDHLSEIFPDNAHVLLAVSGGLDSMTMLHAFEHIHRQQPGRVGGLHVAHLNHQLRGRESDLDAGLVRDQAKAMGLDCSIESIDIERIATERSESIELTARKERYRFLGRIARENDCHYIALAHNADDNVETILHRIIRGTGIQGLAGIPLTRLLEPNEIGMSEDVPLQLIRPLLSFTRQQIEQYAIEQGISYRTDQSNFDEQFTRNRIRHELIPLLKAHYNPNVHTAISQLGNLSAMLAGSLADEAEKLIKDITLEQSPKSLTLDAYKLSVFTAVQQTQIIRQGLIALGVPQQRIGYKNITAVINLLPGNKSKTITLPYNLKVSIAAETLTIALPVEQKNKKPASMLLTIPGSTLLTDYQLPGLSSERLITLEAQTLSGGQDEEKTFRQKKTPLEEMIDMDKVSLPLTVRTRRPGDTFVGLGAPGVKKIGDILTDQKVPVEIRDTLPLICDRKGIIWIAGIRIAQRVKVTQTTTTILKLSIEQ